MLFPTDPDLSQAVSDDTTRMHLSVIYLETEKSRIYATNGHILSVLPVQVETGDVDGPITVAAYLAARKDGGFLSCGADTLTTKSGLAFPRPKGLQGPPIDQVIPSYPEKGDGSEHTVTIGIDPRLLLDLVKAMGRVTKAKRTVAKLTFKYDRSSDVLGTGMLDAIRVESGTDDAIGVIMPCRV